MSPESWDAAALPTPIGDELQPIEIQVGYQPRMPALPQKAPDFNAPGVCPSGCHTPNKAPPPDIAKMELEWERDKSWKAWSADVGALTTTWNEAAAHVRAFKDTASDPSLAAIDGFAIGPKSGNLDEAANAQGVGGQGPKQTGATAISSLFPANGTSVINDEQTKQGFANVSGKLEDEKGAVAKAENHIKEALLGVQAMLHGVTAKASAREAARERVELRKDEKQEADQKEHLEQLKADKEKDMKLVKDLVKVADLMSKAVEKGVGEAATGAVELALEKVIDAQYEDRIKAATAALALTAIAISDRKDVIAQKDFNAAHGELLKAVAEYDKAKASLKTALDDRKEAFRKLAVKAGRLSGADQGTQDRMRAMIQAIPVVKRVVARISNVRSSLAPPAYTAVSGVGYKMAKHANDKSAPQFVLYLSKIKGGQSEFDGRLAHWQARLQSLEAVYSGL